MNYLRIQAGGLYAKLLAERQGNAYLADVAQLSDMSFALDFQKRGGYMQYVSPEMAAYKKSTKVRRRVFGRGARWWSLRSPTIRR